MLGQRVTLAALALAALTGAAAAQNFNLEPTFGRAILPDGAMPHTVDILAGGPLDIAQTIDPGCAGFVADAPDYRIQYTPGGTPLTISVEAPVADTTLLVNDPNGTWYCADDSEGSLNPLITIDAPLAGQYDIWVGTFSSAVAEAVLIINDGSAAGQPAAGPAPAGPPAGPGGPPPLPAGEPAIEYYVAVNGEPMGPIPLEQVLTMVAAGQIAADQLVWHTGLADWAAAGTLPELDAAFNPPAPVEDDPAPAPVDPPPADGPQKPQPAPAPQPDEELNGPEPSGMTLDEVVTVGVNWAFQDVPQEIRDTVIGCLLDAFSPLSPEDRQLVADFGMDPPQEEIDRLEGMHPGMTANVAACEDLLTAAAPGAEAADTEVAGSSVSLDDGRTLTVVGGNNLSITGIDGGYRIIVDENRITYVNGVVEVDGRPREIPTFTTELVFTIDPNGVTITADP